MFQPARGALPGAALPEQPAKELAPSTRVLVTADTWASIETSTFFQAEKFQDLNFAVFLNKGDLPGNMTIYNLTLLARFV